MNHQPVILLLHGHPGAAATMGVFAERLAKLGMRVLSPDLRGYGSFQVRQPFAIADRLQDLEELLQREQVCRCLVLGWSLGGILALELALRLPENVEGLILIAAAARPRGSHPPVPWWQVVNTGLSVPVYRLFPQWRQGWEGLGRRSLLNYLIQQHTPYVYDRIAREGAPAVLRTSRLAHRALNAALRQGYDRTRELSKLTIPCLMLAGDRDRHITADSSAETARLLPDCTWIRYPDTAHLFPWEITEQVLSDIEAWIKPRFGGGFLADPRTPVM